MANFHTFDNFLFVKPKTYPKCHRKGLTLCILKTVNWSIKTIYDLKIEPFESCQKQKRFT